MISRPCRTSQQSSPSRAVPCDSFHDFKHPFYDVAVTCYCMTSLVFHAFTSHSLYPVSQTSPARTRRLWLCKQSRRVCYAQQILEAVCGVKLCENTFVCSVYIVRLNQMPLMKKQEYNRQTVCVNVFVNPCDHTCHVLLWITCTNR